MSDYGLKISESGYDIKTTTDLHLILTSKFPFLKANVQGSGSFTVNSNDVYSLTITHNFGYYPVYMHYTMVDATSASRFLGRWSATSGSGDTIGIESYVTTTNLVIAWQDTASGGTWPFPYTISFYYYLFYDKLA